MQTHASDTEFVPLFSDSLFVIDSYFIGDSHVLGLVVSTVLYSSPTVTCTNIMITAHSTSVYYSSCFLLLTNASASYLLAMMTDHVFVQIAFSNAVILHFVGTSLPQPCPLLLQPPLQVSPCNHHLQIQTFLNMRQHTHLMLLPSMIQVHLNGICLIEICIYIFWLI